MRIRVRAHIDRLHEDFAVSRRGLAGKPLSYNILRVAQSCVKPLVRHLYARKAVGSALLFS